MSKVTPIYEVESEMDEIVKALVEKYPDVFSAVRTDDVRGYVITNKPRPDTKEPEVSISGASGVFAYINPFKYVIVAYASDWVSWTRNQKIINVAKAIKRISEDGNGKLVRFDEMNHRCFLLTFGIGYEEKPDLVNILEEDVKWVF